MQKLKLNIFYLGFFALFTVIIMLAAFDTRLPIFTRAREADVSIAKSLILANKLQAVADNTDIVEITVFARNEAGETLENKSVVVSTSLGEFDKTYALSDKYGRALFRLKSAVSGNAEVLAAIDNQQLSQPLTIMFLAPTQ